MRNDVYDKAGKAAWDAAGNPYVRDRWEDIEQSERDAWIRIARAVAEVVVNARN